MKLWYQSMSRQTEWGGYPAVLRSILSKVKDEGTEIHAHGITNLVKLGEAAVKMNRIMGGRFTSKKCVYAPPPSDQIGAFRKYYGADIYPTVKEA